MYYPNLPSVTTIVLACPVNYAECKSNIEVEFDEGELSSYWHPGVPSEWVVVKSCDMHDEQLESNAYYNQIQDDCTFNAYISWDDEEVEY